MGLDISAHSHILVHRILDEYDEDLEYDGPLDWDKPYYREKWYRRQEYVNPHFPHAFEGTDWQSGGFILYSLKDESESLDFRAGSYGGYGIFRGMIADLAMGVNTYHDRSIFNDINAYRDEPFWEFVNFSDCEGVMGPQCCENLYLDFTTYRDDWVAKVNAADFNWYVDLYDQWTQAFNLGRQDGIVSFH